MLKGHGNNAFLCMQLARGPMLYLDGQHIHEERVAPQALDGQAFYHLLSGQDGGAQDNHLQRGLHAKGWAIEGAWRSEVPSS